MKPRQILLSKDFRISDSIFDIPFTKDNPEFISSLSFRLVEMDRRVGAVDRCLVTEKNIVKISRASEFQRSVNSFHCDGPYRENYAGGARIVQPLGLCFIFFVFAVIITILLWRSRNFATR